MAEIYYFSKVLLNGGWQFIVGRRERDWLAKQIEISLVELACLKNRDEGVD